MTDTYVDRNVTEARIKALRDAQRSAENRLRAFREEPRLPWRVEDEEQGMTREALQQVVYDLTDEIIDLEHTLVDPDSYAERRYEIECAIAASGNWDDCASDYLHTEEEERQFQMGIEAQVRREMEDEHGGWDEYGPCGVCKTHTDEWYRLQGWDFCHYCHEEGQAWLFFLSWVMGKECRAEGRWGEDWYIIIHEDDEDDE